MFTPLRAFLLVTLSLAAIAAPTARAEDTFTHRVAFSADARLVAGNLAGGGAIIAEVATGTRTATLVGAEDRTRFAFSPDAKLVAGISKSALTLWNVATGEVSRTFPPDLDLTHFQGSAAAFSADAKFLAGIWTQGGHTGTDSYVRTWDLSTGDARPLFKIQDEGVEAAVFLPGGESLAAGGMGYFFCWGRLAIWNTPAARLDRTLVGWTAAEQRARSKEAREAKKKEEEVPLMSFLAVALSADAKTLAAAGVFGRLKGKKALGAQDLGGEVILVDPGSGQIERRFPVDGGTEKTPEMPCSVVFSADGGAVAAGTFHGKVHIWDRQTGAAKATIEGLGQEVDSLAFSLDGKTMAAASVRGRVTVIDVAAAKVVATPFGQGTPPVKK